MNEPLLRWMIDRSKVSFAHRPLRLLTLLWEPSLMASYRSSQSIVTTTQQPVVHHRHDILPLTTNKLDTKAPRWGPWICLWKYGWRCWKCFAHTASHSKNSPFGDVHGDGACFWIHDQNELNEVFVFWEELVADWLQISLVLSKMSGELNELHMIIMSNTILS